MVSCERGWSVVVCDDPAHWNTIVAKAGGSLLQSWQWGEFKSGQGWNVLRLLAVGQQAEHAAMQVLQRPVRGLGTFCYAPEGPALPPEAWMEGAPPLRPLLAAAREYGRQVRAFSLRLDPLIPIPQAGQALAAVGLRRSRLDVQPPVTAVLDLAPSENALHAGLDRGARRLLRYAQRDGVTIRSGTSADVPAFAAMIRDTGHRRGFGIRDERYLQGLYTTLCQRGAGDFFVAQLDGIPVAAMLSAPFGPRYFALYGASSARGRDVSAQYLIQWTAILHAKEIGCRFYDFRGVSGNDSPSDPWAGLSFFKRRFGTRREVLPGAWDDIYRPLVYRGVVAAERVQWALRRYRRLARAVRQVRP